MPHGFQVVAQDKDSESGWIQLFNGKDLEGWVPKNSLSRPWRELRQHVQG